MIQTVNVGTILAGKYRVDQILGVGGMGMVVGAMHLELDQRVAIKFMLPEALASESATDRFLREARAVVKLRGEHVCRVLDVGRLDTGAPYIVMEMLDGLDFAKLLRGNAPLTVHDAVDYMLQAMEGVAEAHANGIVHRDLKPANLFVTTNNDGSPLVKVLDFGISKTAAGVAMTKTGDMVGSPAYMAPEQMASSKYVDARADLWALGVILYEAVAARIPFDAETLPQLVMHVMQGAPIPLESIRHDLPHGFAPTVMRCLERSPDARYADVAELAQAIAPYGSQSSGASAARIARVLQRAAAAGTANPRGSAPVMTHSPGPTYPPMPTHQPVLTPPPASKLSQTVASGPNVQPAAGVVSTMQASSAALPGAPSTRSRAGWIAAIAGLVLIGGGAAVFLARGGGEGSGSAVAASEGSDAPAPPIESTTPTAAPANQPATPPVATPVGTPPVATPAATSAVGAPTQAAPPNATPPAGTPQATPPVATPTQATTPPVVTPPTQEAPPPDKARDRAKRPKPTPIKRPGDPKPAPADPIGSGSAAVLPPEPVPQLEPEIPERLTPAMVAQGLARVRAGVISCGDDLEIRGEVTVRIKVAPEGHVLELMTLGTGNTDLRLCVEKKLRVAKFPRTRDGGSFKKAFSL